MLTSKGGNMNGDLISREALNNALENRYLNYEFEKTRLAASG